MHQLDVLLESARGLLQQIGAFLPRLVVALGLLVVGWIVAKVVRFSLVKALRAINFHVLTERAGLDGFLQQGGSRRDTTALVGALAYATAIVGTLVVAFNSLGLVQVTDLLVKVLLFAPRLLVALVIVVFGSYFARVGGRAVTTYCRGAAIGDSELLGRVAQYVIVTFVLLLAVDHLDLGGGLIRYTFLILLGGVVLALALAFGLGLRDRAAELVERWFPRDRGGGAGPG